MITRSRTSRCAALAALLIALAPIAHAGAPAQETRARGEDLLVSTAWLAERLGREPIVLIHVGERAEYDAGHIPGARFISLEEISTPRSHPRALELPPVPKLDELFESLGVSNDSRIVLYYGKDWFSPTARVFLTLDYLGLGGRTSLLDGGLTAWRAEKRPVTTAVPKVARGTLTPTPRGDIVVDAAYVKANLENPKVAIVDARGAEFYTATHGHKMHPREGHIPGAGNLEFFSVVNETGTFKPVAALRQLFRAAGVEPGDRVVTYCHIGQQASLVYFTARYLGYDARLYDGSWEEWSERTELPIVTPKK